MSDQSTQQMTLTFKVAPGQANCSQDGGPTVTWPAVRTPDKPLEAQQVRAGDSASRPYAIAAASGVLYGGRAKGTGAEQKGTGAEQRGRGGRAKGTRGPSKGDDGGPSKGDGAEQRGRESFDLM
jgi:hypothetical protein